MMFSNPFLSKVDADGWTLELQQPRVDGLHQGSWEGHANHMGHPIRRLLVL